MNLILDEASQMKMDLNSFKILQRTDLRTVETT
jgi:hypothetical protein